MVYKIYYNPSIKKDLKKISKTEQARIIDLIDNDLSIKAADYPLLKGKFKGLRKLRIGDYRVIYSLTGDDVFILRIRHRKEVYK